jgi:hypothetical protein
MERLIGVTKFRDLSVRAALALVVAGALAGCGGSSNGPVTFPTDRVELVASYAGVGGLAPASYLVMQGPSLLVYSDGQVVAASRRTLRLRPAELTSLVRDLRGDLDGLGANVTSHDAGRVLDGGATIFEVRLNDGTMRSVSVAALGAVDDYPRGVNRANNRMCELFDRVDKHGDRYTSDRVRLALQPATQPTADVRTWPATVAVPDTVRYSIRTADLDGDAARGVVAALADAEYQVPSSWPVYELADGSRYQVAWRYLAPGEKPA